MSNKPKRQSFIVIKSIPTLLNRLYTPICKRRKDGTYYGAIKKNPDAKKFIQLVQLEAMRQKSINIMKGDVSMMVDFCYTDKRKKDIDGIIKLLLDSLNGVMYKDDSQIVELIVRKHSAQEENEIVVMVEEVLQ